MKVAPSSGVRGTPIPFRLEAAPRVKLPWYETAWFAPRFRFSSFLRPASSGARMVRPDLTLGPVLMLGPALMRRPRTHRLLTHRPQTLAFEISGLVQTPASSARGRAPLSLV